jgi:hypothetical protein
VPAALLLLALAPRLLLVGAALLRRLTPATSRRLALLLSRLSRLSGLSRLLAPAALLRGLALLRRLTVRRLALLWLTPATTLALARGLLTPATTLLRRLAALSPVLPAWLAPRLPRTPWSLRRRRHMCSF